ncbi:triose-phosphate isomerase [Candidatus Bathyarchaeota archaeon]|nr:MAG: triose-phosphate isomerase [Candidatus Bathyarchaeota archaeon]
MYKGKLNLPAIIVNFKCYLEATGEKALQLAKTCEKVSNETGVTVAVAPQFSDITNIARETSIPIFSQHIDPVKPGSHTGHILAEAVKEAGVIGSLINHSERRVPPETVKACVERAKELDLTTLVCADTPETCKRLAVFNPDIIAIEPPELIGTGIPVSRAKPEVVTEAVKAVETVNPSIPVLCGAGISTGVDVSAALKLGTKGVLLASGVVKAKDPRKVLLEMAESMVGSLG